MSHLDDILKSIETLSCCIHNQLVSGIENVCTQEMAEATDMVKDLSESLYYCTIVKAMNEGEEEDYAYRYYNDSRNTKGQYTRRGYETRYPEVYDPNNMFSNNKFRLEQENQNGMRHKLESRYERAKRGYTESRMLHSGNTTEDKNANIASLDEYINELTYDITEMIKNASPEEKTALKTKLNVLATKI